MLTLVLANFVIWSSVQNCWLLAINHLLNLRTYCQLIHVTGCSFEMKPHSVWVKSTLANSVPYLNPTADAAEESYTTLYWIGNMNCPWEIWIWQTYTQGIYITELMKVNHNKYIMLNKTCTTIWKHLSWLFLVRHFNIISFIITQFPTSP